MTVSHAVSKYAPALLPLLIAAVACGGPKEGDPAIAKHRASHAYSKGSIPAEFRGQVPALSDAQVLGFLPDTTVAAWFLRSPKALDSATEFSVILSEYTEVYAEMLPHITTPSGANFFVPATWTRMGIDPERPAGVAAMLGDDIVGVFFATLSNKELFRKSLDEVAAKAKLGPLVAASAGESTIYVFQNEDDIAFVVRGDVAMLVIPDRDRDLEAAVLAVAGTSSQPTLAGSGRVAKAFAGFDHGKDMAGFVALDTIAAKLFAKRGRQQQDFGIAENERMKVVIAEAKAQNQSAEEIATLEKELLESMRWQREARLRQEAQEKLVQGIFGDTGTIAMGIELDGATTRARAQLSPLARGFAARLFQKPTRSFALPGRLAEKPVALLGAHVNPSVAKEILNIFIEADGTTHKELSSDIYGEIGLTLDEITALFDGELSAALTADWENSYIFDPEASDPKDAMGLHLLGHLGDPAAARALFDKMCNHRKLVRFVVQSGGKKALEVPSFNKRKLRIEVSGDFLEVQSIIAKPTPVQWSESEKQLIDVPSSPAVLVLDAMLLSRYMGSSEEPHYLYRAQAHEDSAATARAKPVRDELTVLYQKRARLLGTQRSSSESSRFVASAHPFAGGYAVLARVVGKSKNLGRSLQSIVESISPDVAEARSGKIDALVPVNERINELEGSLWSLVEGPTEMSK